MAEGKKSFILYCDQRGIFDKLSDEQSGKLIKHIFSYVSDENPESDFVTELAFESIKQQLKRDLKKYETYIDKQRENGKKGGRPKAKKPNPFSENPTKPKKADTVNDNDTVNVTVNDNVSTIVDYLNGVVGSSFKPTTRTTKESINARLKEGFTVEDFKRVIDIKYQEWGNDEKFCKFLRPQTLFGSKFESYLNQQPAKQTREDELNIHLLKQLRDVQSTIDSDDATYDNRVRRLP